MPDPLRTYIVGGRQWPAFGKIRNLYVNVMGPPCRDDCPTCRVPAARIMQARLDRLGPGA